MVATASIMRCGAGRSPWSQRCHTPGRAGVLTYVYRLGQMPGRTPKGTKPMKLAVFGANGPTGRLLTQLALDEDHDVVAFTRHPGTLPIEHRRLEVAAGDVHDPVAVAMAIDGADAVISTLGVPFAKVPIPLIPKAPPTSLLGCTPRASSACFVSAPVPLVPTPNLWAGLSSRGSCSPMSSISWARPSTTTCGGWKPWCRPPIWPGPSCAPRGCLRRRPFPPTASPSTTSATGTPPGSTWPIASCGKL